MKLTETSIAKAIANGMLNHRSTLVVPKCHWLGPECDLLVIDRSLRVIDVEIKISRADLKADRAKQKWQVARHWSRRNVEGIPTLRAWPEKAWKHIYIVPAAIWDDKMLATISDASGVILVSPDSRYRCGLRSDVVRPAKPNKDAKPITPADAIDIARLASLRMWAALTKDENGHLPDLQQEEDLAA